MATALLGEMHMQFTDNRYVSPVRQIEDPKHILGWKNGTGGKARWGE